MKNTRKLYIIGDIDEEAYLNFTTQLAELEADGNKDVHVELNSGGGTAFDALAFYSRITTSPCDIIITARGVVMSAAVLILAAGDKRIMAAEAWVMVHEDSVKFKGNITNLEKEAKNRRMFENQWNYLLAERTHLSKEQWEAFHKEGDLYLSPNECYKYGLIDEVK